MEPQDVQAKNTARTKRTTKVSRQSSLCRFSNCSKREETEARWSACCAERPAVWGARWLSSGMQGDGTLQSQEASADTSYALIVRIPTGFQQSKRLQEVPEGHLYELHTNNNGAPAEPERRLIWFFCPA